MGLKGDTRGASIAINHALSLGITALLISGLLLGAGGLLDRQQEQVARSGLQSIGESLTTEVMGVDELSTQGVDGNGEVRSTIDYPTRIAGTSYDLKLLVRPDGTTVLYANKSDPQLSIPIQFHNDTRVCERGINGGPTSVVYDASQDCVTIEPAGR